MSLRGFISERNIRRPIFEQDLKYLFCLASVFQCFRRKSRWSFLAHYAFVYRETTRCRYVYHDSVFVKQNGGL